MIAHLTVPHPLAVLALAALALLVAIWVVYPAVIALVAARRSTPRSRGDVAGAPTVTVVVASADDAAAILEKLADVLATSYPPDRLDVVVALDAVNGRARPSEIRAAGPRVTAVVGDPAGGKAATLNAGVRAATGELLVFADTHQRFDAHAIPRLVAAMGAEPRLGIASGALDPAPRAGRDRPTLADHYWRYERWLREREAAVHSAVGVTGAIYVMRRALWEPLPAGLILDDVYTPMRLVLAGQRVGFVADARAVDRRRFGPEQEYQRKVRTLTGVLQLCAWLPAVLVPWRNPIWLQFLFHKLLRLLTPYLVLLLAAATGGLALLAILARGRTVALAAAAAIAALGLLLILLPPLRPVRRRAGGLLRWGVALQAAVVTASFNGLRGRWDVWRR